MENKFDEFRGYSVLSDSIMVWDEVIESNIGICIRLLENLIENWYDMQLEYGGFEKRGFSVTDGLCWNCHFYGLPLIFKHSMFKSWMYFGTLLKSSSVYPIGEEESYKDRLLENPLRFHLAVHCLRFLKAIQNAKVES